VADEPQIVLVTMAFEASDADRLLAVLANYVVLSRGHHGCINIDLTVSVTTPNRFVVIQKWASSEDQRRHFDSADMVAMATACDGLLASPPAFDLLDGLSAHDLR